MVLVWYFMRYTQLLIKVLEHIYIYIYVLYSKDSHLKHLISVKDDTIEYLGLLI